MVEIKQSELFFGLAGAAGTNFSRVIGILQNCLGKVSFKTEPIRLSDFFSEIETYDIVLKESPEEQRIATRMEAGDKFREDTGLGDAVALLAINKIKKIRIERNGTDEKPLSKVAFVFNSLKHPKEVLALRKVYGSAFMLISVYSPVEARKQNLAKQIAKSHHDAQFENYYDEAEKLIKRDQSEAEIRPLGQNVRDTFPLGDVFIDSSNEEKLEQSLNRFVELLFGNTFHTPTVDEFGMFTAHASARRSSSLARQVGAVIINEKGDIIAAGMNEVPRPEGGVHTADHKPDLRNWRKGEDPSDERKAQILGDILTRLNELGYMNEKNVDKLVKVIKPKIKNAHLMNLIEFNREVHAEMAAITSAARNTVSIDKCTMYTTTFPCHECTKHIIASGIRNVIYVEPYHKSLAIPLYSDFIQVDGASEQDNKVKFRAFVGVAPRRYLGLFEKGERKDGDGKVIAWINTEANPRFYEPSRHYLLRESEAVELIGKNLQDKGVKLKYPLAEGKT